MKIVIHPYTWIGKLLVKMRIKKPLELFISFEVGKFTVTTNKPRVLNSLNITFTESFASDNLFKNQKPKQQ